MNEPIVRPARADDATFLAVAIRDADRAHTGIGTWDVILPDAATQTDVVARLVTAEARSFVHWSTFLVAEVDGAAVGTVAGYVPDETPPDTFLAACDEVLGELGWSPSRVRDAQRGAWSRDYFGVVVPGDTLRLEWVYTAPRARGHGVSSRLVGSLLESARASGRRTSHVGAYLDNEPALATYRRAGFVPFAECRHADYQARFGTPGLAFLRRTL